MLVFSLKFSLKQVFLKGRQFNWKIHVVEFIFRQSSRLRANNFTGQFSYVTKSRIFKNRNLRRKADRHFRGSLLKNHFRHLKFYSNPPSLLARSRCHMSAFWKTKGWSSHFWEGQPFRFCYVGVHRQRRLKSAKIGISTGRSKRTSPQKWQFLDPPPPMSLLVTISGYPPSPMSLGK